MNNTGTKHHFSRGGAARKKISQEISDVTDLKKWRSQPAKPWHAKDFYLQNILKSGGGAGGEPDRKKR